MKSLGKKLRRFCKAIGHRGQSADACPMGFVRMGDFSPDDIFIAGYPKSGNTWMQVLVSCITYGIDPDTSPDSLIQELVPDVHYKRHYKRFRESSCFKTHDLPKPEFQRVINIVRDGRDVLCSYKPYNEALGGTFDMDSAIDEGSGLGCGTWQDHALAWDRNPFGAEKIVVRYEDLIDDCVGELGRISRFIGITRTRSELAAIAAATTAEQMKRREVLLGWDNKAWPKDKAFVRVGKKGTYERELTAAQIGRFNARAETALRLHGYLPTAIAKAA
jgi:hypothetical protein